MKNRLPVPLAVALLLAACGAPPLLATPDGSTRAPVNSPRAMAEYNTAAERDLAASREQERTLRQLQQVKGDIAQLKTYMAEAAFDHHLTPESASSPSSPALPPATAKPVSTASSRRPASPPSTPTESIRADDQVTLFRTTFDTDDSRFTPSFLFRQSLVKAAKTARAITIRGATDSLTRTDASERIAKARAENARKYLIANGVDPAKLKSSFIAAGGFVADNSTPAGRSKNRRVDIEVIKQDKAIVSVSGQPHTGAAQ